MRAFQKSDAEAPARLTEIDRPSPGPGQILLRNRACALNFADLLMLEGRYQDTPEPPFCPGMEVSGTVEELGPDVEGPAPGSRVALFAGQGGLAEFGCYAAERAVVLPEALDFDTAAALPIAHGTSHLALTRRAGLRAGETLLVLGAGGGVGLSAVEIGRRMGARVIACARGPEKLEAARRAGAEHLIDSATTDLRAEVLGLGGADVVYDPVGGAQFTAAFRACRPEARILCIGFASGEVPPIPANHLMVKNISVLGVNWGGYLGFAPEALRDSLAQLFDWAASGDIAPHIGHRLPLERVEEALALLSGRQAIGKVVVTL